MNASTEIPSLSRLLIVGGIAMAIVLALVAAILASFEQSMITSWVGFVFLVATPPQIVMALFWRMELPEFIGRMQQPLKGLALTGLLAAVTAVLVPIGYYTVGGGTGAPTPMHLHCAILCILVALWVFPIWHCWPLTLFLKNPLHIGIGGLLLTYLISWVLFLVLFDFSFLAGAPFYAEAMDPKGLLNAWTALTLAVASVALVFVLVLFDFWPVAAIARDFSQPKFGLVATAMVLPATAILYLLFVTALGMDRVDFLVRGPVSFLFGAFLVSDVMQNQLLVRQPQPVRGALLTLCAFVLALVLYQIYAAVAPIFHGGPVPGGMQAGYQLDVWIANAMLALTFPLIVVVTGFFGFWPVLRDQPATAEQTPPQS